MATKSALVSGQTRCHPAPPEVVLTEIVEAAQ